MNVKKALAVAFAASAIATGLTLTASPALALTCYDVGFSHSPSAYVTGTPPRLVVDDGDPYVRQYAC